MILDLLRQLLKPAVRSLNSITIEQQAIIDNYNLLQKFHQDDGIFPVVKSNAYGHGLKEIAKILKNVSAPYICVDSFPEYQIVKDYSESKALVMGETFPENYNYYDFRYATLCVSTLESIRYLVAKKQHATIHLFLNTGMNREGMQRGVLRAAVALLRDAPWISVEGIISHFANADETDRSFNAVQYDQFVAMGKYIEGTLGTLRWKHIGNSAGTITESFDYCNARRTGLALYGYSPFVVGDVQLNDALRGLRPALTVASTIVALQDLEANQGVSYGLRWKSDLATRVGSIPFGYAEGLVRSLSGCDWKVRRNDQYFPIIGSICMNLSTIKIGDHPVSIGDRVTIIDADKSAPNSLAQLATLAKIIPYEALVNLSPTIKRVIV